MAQLPTDFPQGLSYSPCMSHRGGAGCKRKEAVSQPDVCTTVLHSPAPIRTNLATVVPGNTQHFFFPLDYFISVSFQFCYNLKTPSLPSRQMQHLCSKVFHLRKKTGESGMRRRCGVWQKLGHIFSIVQYVRTGPYRKMTHVQRFYTEYNVPGICLFAIQWRPKALLSSAHFAVHFTNKKRILAFYLLFRMEKKNIKERKAVIGKEKLNPILFIACSCPLLFVVWTSNFCFTVATSCLFH